MYFQFFNFFSRCKPSSFSYAGTKDKRAVTSQWFCIKKRQPDAIIRAANAFTYNFRVGNFTYKNTPLQLGDLNGNRFQIVLRSVDASEELINQSMDSLKTYGFINYYGLQRFGNCMAIPTFEVGKAMLKMNWKAACELILKPRQSEPGYMQKMRSYWWKTRNARGALNMLAKWNRSIEARLLLGLVKCGNNDYLNALSMVSFENIILNRLVI